MKTMRITFWLCITYPLWGIGTMALIIWLSGKADSQEHTTSPDGQWEVYEVGSSYSTYLRIKNVKTGESDWLQHPHPEVNYVVYERVNQFLPKFDASGRLTWAEFIYPKQLRSRPRKASGIIGPDGKLTDYRVKWISRGTEKWCPSNDGKAKIQFVVPR